MKELTLKNKLKINTNKKTLIIQNCLEIPQIRKRVISYENNVQEKTPFLKIAVLYNYI